MHGDLIDLERKFWTNDPQFYEANYTANAVLVFPRVGRIDRTTAVAAIRPSTTGADTTGQVNFGNVAAVELMRDVVLLSYTATARWNTRIPRAPRCT